MSAHNARANDCRGRYSTPAMVGAAEQVGGNRAPPLRAEEGLRAHLLLDDGPCEDRRLLTPCLIAVEHLAPHRHTHRCYTYLSPHPPHLLGPARSMNRRADLAKERSPLASGGAPTPTTRVSQRCWAHVFASRATDATGAGLMHSSESRCDVCRSIGHALEFGRVLGRSGAGQAPQMPGATPRLTGRSARGAPGVLGVA